MPCSVIPNAARNIDSELYICPLQLRLIQRNAPVRKSLNNGSPHIGHSVIFTLNLLLLEGAITFNNGRLFSLVVNSTLSPYAKLKSDDGSKQLTGIECNILLSCSLIVG